MYGAEVDVVLEDCSGSSSADGDYEPDGENENETV